MSINLSQLKAEKVRVTIPLYIDGEFVDNIEIYNPTNAVVKEINQAIQNQEHTDVVFKSKLIKELTNINIDCELNDDYIQYYSDIFVQVMLEIDDIIFEVLANYMVELDKLQNISENKLQVFNNVLDSFQAKLNSDKEESNKIEIRNEKIKQKIELEKQIAEANAKLEQLEGEEIG